MICSFNSGASLQVSSGSFVYRNIDTNSWKMLDNNATLYINSGVYFKLYQSLNMGRGQIFFNGGSAFLRASEKDVFGSMHILGRIVYGNL